MYCTVYKCIIMYCIKVQLTPTIYRELFNIRSYALYDIITVRYVISN